MMKSGVKTVRWVKVDFDDRFRGYAGGFLGRIPGAGIDMLRLCATDSQCPAPQVMRIPGSGPIIRRVLVDTCSFLTRRLLCRIDGTNLKTFAHERNSPAPMKSV